MSTDKIIKETQEIIEKLKKDILAKEILISELMDKIEEQNS